MKRWFFVWTLLCAGQGFAQQDALQWLQRAADAAQKLSYSGTFVYRNGTQSETSRIVHASSNGRQTERLEVLDGSPREVIRNDDEVKCYLPESRLVIVEHRSARRMFPALLPSSLAGLNDHYVLRRNGSARIAGLDSQILRLEPRDGWRYGHQFWIDGSTGLLLKADIFDERGESLESIAFTELRIGEPSSAEISKPGIAAVAQKDAWQVRQTKTRDLRDDAPWVFRGELPGFRRLASMRRVVARDAGESQEVLHWVFSDGLAALSVFISPARGSVESVDASVKAIGSINVVKRAVDGHQVVVMGDVPPAAVKRFAEGVGVRGK